MELKDGDKVVVYGLPDGKYGHHRGYHNGDIGIIVKLDYESDGYGIVTVVDFDAIVDGVDKTNFWTLKEELMLYETYKKLTESEIGQIIWT